MEDVIVILLSFAIFIIVVILIFNKKGSDKKKISTLSFEDLREQIRRENAELTKDDNYDTIITFTVKGSFAVNVNNKLLMRDIKVNDSLKLQPESWNVHDSNAIVVNAKFGQIGYVPAYLTSYFFNTFKQLRPYKCSVVKVGGQVGDIIITARVEFSDVVVESEELVDNNKKQQRVEPKDILDGIDVNKFIDNIARKLLYSEYGYGDNIADISEDIYTEKKDVLLEEAARLIVIHQQGSTSLIQRKFLIGYNRAGKIMDQLEAIGVVGAAQGSAARAVFIADEYALESKLKSIEPEFAPMPFDDEIIDAVEERYYDKIQLRKEYLLKNYQQEEELNRLYEIDKEKEEIRAKLLEKDRKKQLEKQIRQDLIDEGLIDPD